MFRARVSRLIVALALLALTACQADAVIDLDVDADGSGTITVDVTVDEAVDEALGGFAQQVRFGDLERAGWDVTVDDGDGAEATVTATKPVPSADSWQSVLDEIAGPGVFNDVEVGAGGGFGNARQQVSFTLDLSEGWDLFSDAEVAAALDGERFGAPIEDLTDGRSIDDIVSVTVQAAIASDSDSAPISNSWTQRFDSADDLRVTLASTTENSLAILLRWIAIALAALFALATVLAITGIVLQRRSDRLRPTSTPRTLASRVPGAKAAPAAAATAPSGRDSVRLVVIEPLTVLYQQGRGIDDVLLPFVRSRGGTARADTILEGHRGLLSGGTDTAAFWELCGLEEPAAELDRDFLETRVLHSGAADFFAEMQRRRIPIAATTNDAETWSSQVRERDRLSAVWPWLVSASVGTRTSNGAMFEVLRRESGVAHGHCLYVDSDLESLDAAKELGMKTALFNTGDLDLPAVVGHPVVKNFKGLFGSK